MTAPDATEAARAEYRTRRAHACYDNASAAEFDAACLALAPATPEAWIAAADRVRFTCRRCAGTGAFITYTENGQPKGPGGACFRCQGQGTQSWIDGRRDAYHDQHYTGNHT